MVDSLVVPVYVHENRPGLGAGQILWSTHIDIGIGGVPRKEEEISLRIFQGDWRVFRVFDVRRCYISKDEKLYEYSTIEIHVVEVKKS